MEVKSGPVLCERRGSIVVITINRPEARNACNQAVWIGVGDALARAEADQTVRSIILTGAGHQAFCAGADLKAITRGEPIIPDDPVKAGWGFAGVASHVISTPLIAAVNGVAAGGGTELALACDIVIATEGSTFGLPEVKRGLLAAAGGVFRLPQQVPQKVAMEMLLTGDLITAQRAYELGLVNRVVTSANLMDAAMDMAERIAANAPVAVQAAKRVARGIEGEVERRELECWTLSDHEASMVLASEDAREGALAFSEKRSPIWRGC